MWLAFSQILKEEKEEQEVHFLAYDRLCQCQVHIHPSEAVNSCNKAISIKEEARLYCDRAEAHIADEMFDEGEFPSFISLL